MILSQLRPAAVALALMTALTGVIYPLAVTAAAQAFPRQAHGDLTLIGKSFDDPKQFWGRLSATSGHPYDAMGSTGSNLGPTNPALAEAAKARIDALRAADPDNRAPIPVDLVTASGSGLDPHISPAAAEWQIARVAHARNVPEEKVRALVVAHTEQPDLGFLGDPRVNVVTLNAALGPE